MASSRPFRFSAVVERATSRAEWIAKARLAETLGYTTLLVPDHLWIDVDPAVALMAAADATSLRIGSHVFSNDFRNPAMLAKQAATLDMLSDGRFQLGLGCGYHQPDYEQVGIQYDPAGVRVSRFEEALHLIKAFFAAKDVVNFSGQYYSVKNLKAIPKPVQQHLPIYIGGGGKRMMSIAAREADIIGLGAKYGSKGLEMTSILPAANYEKLEWIRQAAGERFEHIELSATIFLVAVTDTREQVAEHLAGRFGLTAPQLLGAMNMLFGTVDQIVEALQQRREQFGVSCIEVTEEHMEKFAPAVERLSGK